ncbi:MAG: B12-binding domain-containing radical SAM protein [Anaerolineae bacterium]|nr:B12-binding domain-containing radical SAM protein [Anaerolineae bacterium]
MKPQPAAPTCDLLLLGYEEWENLGLRYIAAFLLENGVRARVHPLGAPPEQILDLIRRENPAIVGFSLIFQRMLPDFAGLIAYLRANGVRAHFTIGGHFPSIEPQLTLQTIPGLDSVVCGEGELTLLELFRRLPQPGAWDQIKGLAFRDAPDGSIHLTPPRPKIPDLDSLPYPVRAERMPTHRGLGLCSILASRGCYYDCSFCSIQTFYGQSPGPRRRARSPANVAAEMEQLFHQRGMRLFVFEDDDLFMRGRVPRQWIDGLVRELKQRDLADHILWRVSCRVDDVDPEPIAAMMEAGLMSVYIGIESGNNHGLETFNKHYTVDDIHRALAQLRAIGVPYEYGFMVLSPDTTFATLREDIAFLKEISAGGEAVLQFTKMLPYSGTPINRRLQREGRLAGDLAAPDYDYLDPRLGLLQLFFSEAFHDRNFDPKGLAERLRFAKLDVAVVRKYFSAQYDAQAYAAAVRDLIRRSNEEALEKMSMAVHFMASRTQAEIVGDWLALELLVQEEKRVEAQLSAALEWLMASYDSQAELVPAPQGGVPKTV